MEQSSSSIILVMAEPETILSSATMKPKISRYKASDFLISRQNMVARFTELVQSDKFFPPIAVKLAETHNGRVTGTLGKEISMVLEQFPLTALITMIASIIYYYFGIKVGGARLKHSVLAPKVDGPEDFQRVHRVHQNTLEQLIVFFPALWIFALAWGDLWAAIFGVIFCLGRILYARGYYEAAEKRSKGFGISALATMVLMLGALIGAIAALL